MVVVGSSSTVVGPEVLVVAAVAGKVEASITGVVIEAGILGFFYLKHIRVRARTSTHTHTHTHTHTNNNKKLKHGGGIA